MVQQDVLLYFVHSTTRHKKYKQEGCCSHHSARLVGMSVMESGDQVEEEQQEGGQGQATPRPTQGHLLLLWMVADTLVRFLSKEVGFQLLAVQGLIGWSVVNLGWRDSDPG